VKTVLAMKGDKIDLAIAFEPLPNVTERSDHESEEGSQATNQD
jgi:hypothetical protein